MRSIQLTQHLGQHIAEVVYVVDVWQELLVNLFIASPVHTMQIVAVELIVNLAPDVLEQILTLGKRTVVEVGFEINSLTAAFRDVDTAQRPLIHKE